MTTTKRFRLHISLLVVTVLCCSLDGLGRTAAEADDDVELSHYYGFLPLEIFKLEQRSGNMLSADMNNDGLIDLVLVDNSHSRIDVLQQRKSKPDSTDFVPERSVNFVENDWRFEHRKISVDKNISSLSLGDFNSDGRTDIAYFGTPDRLIIRLQSEAGDWNESTSYRLPGVPAARWSMAAGDLNSDGRDDLVVLGTDETYLAIQTEEGTITKPDGLMNTSENLGLCQIADLDGDGRNDLCYVATNNQDRMLCARLQDSDGMLGPELCFDLNRPRAVSLADVDPQQGLEILTIDRQTGRIKVQKLARPEPKPGELPGRLVQYGFRRQGSRGDRDLATGDLDGDGLVDVVLTDPEGAQMIVFTQNKERGLDLGRTFPGFDGSSQVRVGDFNGDGIGEVVVLSPKEKSIGISSMHSGRLPFPRALPIEGEPVAVELADLNGDGLLEIVYLSDSGSGRNAELACRALQRGADDQWSAYTFGETAADPAVKTTAIEIKTSRTPERLVRVDANADGRPDFLLFYGSGRVPELLTVDEQGLLVQVATEGGIRMGAVDAGAVFIGRTDQPLVLVAQENFARNLQLDENGQWRVIEQYNASEANARIDGVASLDLDGQPGDEVVLVDTGIRKLRLLKRVEGVYRPWKEVEIGPFQYQSVRVADLNGDGYDDLLLFGREKFAVLYTGRTEPSLKELASFETKLEKTYFADVVGGDLNGDRRADLAVTDTRSHYIEILHYDAKLGLRHALHFKAFEEKSFSSDEDSGADPREVLISDVTGDGRPDLILLTHDRVLVYPQDSGE